jgi:glycosyltransferase involved in cell wall biosynthesis
MEIKDFIKISVVMQVSLQDYPGSRKEPVDKFIRAVNSFKNQKYKNCELVIVSDGCKNALDVYDKNFKNDTNIKFAYVDKSAPMMYQKNNEGEKYYRGFPRQVGITMADGELITYMDSDDVLSPKFTLTILYVYNTYNDCDWWINGSWYDNQLSDMIDNELVKIDKELIELDYISDKWKRVISSSKYVVMTPWLLTHRKSCDVQWKDTIGSVSEDSFFNKELRKKYKNGKKYQIPVYVRCHYSNKWDV